MDRLIIDNKEVEFGGEVGIYLTYRSNIMNPDISKILGNNSSTIKIPHTIHNASIIENAQMVMSDTRFPYIKHSADVVRDGITLIQGATVILLKTTPEEYELSLVWGVSEGLRQMAEDNAKLGALADYLATQKVEWKLVNSGTKQIPEAMYGLIREWEQWFIKYTSHPVVPLMEVLRAIVAKYGASIEIPEQIEQELGQLVMPIMRGVQPKITVTFSRSAGEQYDTTGIISWDSIIPYPYTPMYCDGNTIVKDEVKPISVEADVVAYIDAKRYGVKRIQDDSFISIMKRTIQTEEGVTQYDDEELIRVPCTRAERVEHAQYGDVIEVHFTANLVDDYEAYQKDDVMLVKMNSYSGIAEMNLVAVGSSSIKMVLQKQFTEVGEYYYLGDNLPDIDIMKWLKGVMQLLGVYAFQNSEGNIVLNSYTSFFSETSHAQDWSDYLCITSTHASENQEFKADGFARKNWVRYKNDDSVKNMDFYFHVDSEILEAENDYLTLPFDSVEKVEGDPARPSIAKIPMYTTEVKAAEGGGQDITIKRNTSEEKKAYVLRNVQTDDGFYLSRAYLSWEHLLDKYYQGIIQSVQQSHYITATFLLDAVTLQTVDFRYPIYLSQYASYFAIIEIKTKKNNLAEVKLLKLV